MKVFLGWKLFMFFFFFASEDDRSSIVQLEVRLISKEKFAHRFDLFARVSGCSCSK